MRRVKLAMFSGQSLNRLTSAQDAATDGGAATILATFTYDAVGNRIERDTWASGGTTTVIKSAHDGSSAWSDLTTTNTLQTRYFGGGGGLARDNAGSASWYLHDWEGSVRNLTDASGNLQDTITYDGFGNVTSESNAAATDRFKYAGGERDAITGLQYQGARYYDPSAGRWLRQDQSPAQRGSRRRQQEGRCGFFAWCALRRDGASPSRASAAYRRMGLFDAWWIAVERGRILPAPI